MTDEDESRPCQKCGSRRIRLTRRVIINKPEGRVQTEEYVCDNPQCKAKLVKPMIIGIYPSNLTE
jgi:hypothetical protein